MSENKHPNEADQIINRVKRETESLGKSSLAKTAEKINFYLNKNNPTTHSQQQSEETKAEIWGKRIGHILSLIGTIIMVIWLASQLNAL